MTNTMKLSDAIIAGSAYAQVEIHNGGFFSFSPDYSLAASKIGADALFAAYLGRYQGKGLLKVIRALKSHDRPTQAACWIVLDGLSQAFRDLGTTCTDRVRAGGAAASEMDAPPPGKKESLWMYICRLNDEHTWTRAKISALLQRADL